MGSKNKLHIIRLLQAKDLPCLVELCEAHAHYEGSTYDKAGKEEKLKVHLLKEDSAIKCWVVQIENAIEGYAILAPEFSTWDANYYYHMDCLYLTEKCRGKGIGTEIMDTLKKFVHAQNMHQIQWQTPMENEGAIHFYLKNGAISKDKKRFYLKPESV